MKAKTLLLALVIMAFAVSLSAAPRLINYQGMLTDKQGKPVTTPVEVAFTFWDAETSGTQMGAGFSDTDTVTPDVDGIYSTLIGDDPDNLIPETVFAGDSVWLNVNIAGDNLANRMRITSAGFAINAMNAGHATTADSATNASHAVSSDSATNAITAGTAGHSDTSTTATVALGLAGALKNPGDQITLGTNAYININAAGTVEIIVNGQHYRLGTQHWKYPSNITDNISPDGQIAHEPQVAMDDNGNTIVTWYQYDGSTWQIFKSEYRGVAWVHPLSLSDNISPDGQHAQSPKVAMDNNGNAIITWYQNDGSTWQIFKSEYRDGIWTHPSSLSDNISPDGQNALYPRVAMDNNGNAIITWQQSDGAKTQIFKSEYRGGIWTHPSSLSDNISPDGQNAEYPQVAMDNNRDAIIVWQQSDGANYQIFKSEYREDAWYNPSDLSDNISPDGQNAYEPKVAMDNNGNAIITWQQYNGSSYKVFKSEYRGGVWTHPSSLSDNINPFRKGAYDPQVAMENKGDSITKILALPLPKPTVAMDNNGNAIITWFQYNGSKYQIFKSEYRGGVWTHPSSLSDNINPDGQDAYFPQVAMDNNGNAIITWHQYDGSISQIFKSEYRGGVWTHPSSLTDNISPDGQNANYPQVAMDNNGNAIIVWYQYDGSRNQIFFSEYRWGF